MNYSLTIYFLSLQISYLHVSEFFYDIFVVGLLQVVR